MVYASIMKDIFTLILVFFFVASCGTQEEDTSPPDKMNKISDVENKNIRTSDAPSLPSDTLFDNAFVGNTFSYKRTFSENFENIEIPRLPPPGAGPEYKIKRNANDSGLVPVSKGRLRFKNDNQPFSGKVFRHFLSGQLEHFSVYENGFRVGNAYWWNLEGNLKKISQGWGFDHQELEILPLSDDPSDKQTENPIDQLSETMKRLNPELAESSLFGGLQSEWEEWFTVNSDGITISLHNGENLTGEVKIYSDDGNLNLIRRYKDGLLEGELASYHANGIQSQSVQYKEGIKNGEEIWWQDNGFKSYSASYLDGNLHGKTYNWDENGFLVSEVEFDHGKPLRPINGVSSSLKQVQ